MDDVQNEKATETTAAPLARPPMDQGAIRGAFLARAAHGGDTAAGGGIQGDAGAATLRGAFMKHLTEKPGGAVVGDEAGGAGVVRSIYAARSTVVAITVGATARPRRKAKAAPAKKRARAATKRAQPAKRGPKKRRAAAPSRARPTRPPARAKKKKKAKGRR
jgi:hypothetical protein